MKINIQKLNLFYLHFNILFSYLHFCSSNLFLSTIKSLNHPYRKKNIPGPNKEIQFDTLTTKGPCSSSRTVYCVIDFSFH